MGSWGTGLFSNDVAHDVREEYVNRLKLGASDKDALTHVMIGLSEYLKDEEDAIDFWLSLASILYDYGRLTEDIKNKAMDIITRGDDYRWEKSQLKKRSQVLAQLKRKLENDQPQRKLVKVLKPYICQYQAGDIFIYRLDSNLHGGKAYCNWYFYILIDEVVNFDTRIPGLGDKFPLIYIKYSQSLPENPSKIDNCSFIETEGVNSGEHRIQMYDDGFKKFFEKCLFWGNYNYRRTANIYDNPVFIMRPAREIDDVICEYLDGIL